MGCFGKLRTFIDVCLGGFAEFFALVVPLPTLIFTAMDYEGHKNGDEVRYNVLDEKGKLKSDAGSKLGGIPENTLRLIPLIVQLGGGFHMQQVLLKFLYYNEFDSNSFGCWMLYCDGEVSKYGAKARASRKTKRAMLNKMTAVQLRLRLEGRYKDKETQDAIRLKGKSIKHADKNSLVDKTLELETEEDDLRNEKEPDLFDGMDDNALRAELKELVNDDAAFNVLTVGRGIAVDKANRDDVIIKILELSDISGKNAVDEGDEKEEEEEEAAAIAEEEEEDEEGDGKENVVLDPEDILMRSRKEDLVAIVEKAEAATIDEKQVLYEELQEVWSKTPWNGTQEFLDGINNIYERCCSFLREAGENRITTLKNKDDSLSMACDVKRIDVMSGAETISYTRLHWRATLHWLAWQLCRAQVLLMLRAHEAFVEYNDLEERAFIAAVCAAHPGMCTFFLFFDTYLDTCIGSFRRWFDGDFSELLNRFFLIALWMCYANNYQLAWCMFSLIDTLKNLETNHPDVFYYVCKMSRFLFSDTVTELFNARFGSMLNTGALKSEQYLKKKSILAIFPARITALLRKIGDKVGLVKGDNELERRHKRGKRDKYKTSVQSIANIIIKQVELILDNDEAVRHINNSEYLKNREKAATQGEKSAWYHMLHYEEVLAKSKEKKDKPMTLAEIKVKCKELVEFLIADKGDYVARGPERPQNRPQWLEYLFSLQKERQEVERRLSKERKDKLKILQKKAYLAGRVTSRGRVSRPYVATDMEY